MPIHPTPQALVVSSQSFVVTLKSDLAVESDSMQVLVQGQPRKFSLVPGQPPQDTQPVTVLGQSPVSVQAGWGTAADKGSSLEVAVGANRSAPVVIR